jgi:hypothetical protein
MLSDWWNGVELWMLGLPFPFQFALVIAVLVPLCLVVAWLIDRIVDHASAFFGPAKVPEPPLTEIKTEEPEATAEVEPVEEPVEEPAEVTEGVEIVEPAAGARVPAESTGR